MFELWVKRSCLLGGVVLLFCLSPEVIWAYGENNSAYTEVPWQEPEIELLSRNFEFAIGDKFKVDTKPISDAEDIQVRIFRGDRKKLSERKPAINENCVTFSSVVANIKNVNGHIKWWDNGHVGPTWLALREHGDTEELSEQKFFVKFEFKENNFSEGAFKLHKEDIEQYFGEERAGFTITVVPRWENKIPNESEKKNWISEIKKWQEKRLKRTKTRNQERLSVCIQFVKSQREENLKVAKAFKCHELKT